MTYLKKEALDIQGLLERILSGLERGRIEVSEMSKGMEEQAKTQIKAGDTVTAYGYDWEVLDPEYEGEDGPGILCLIKGLIRTMAFSEDGCNDYAKSDIKKYLEDEFTPELEELGAEFRTAELDLTADDGTGWDKEPLEVKGAFLLTDDLYRRYRRYISNKEDWWWTATAYSFISGSSYDVRSVTTDGSRYNSYARIGNYGLAPACIFSFLPEQGTKDTAEEIVELKKRVTELEKRIKELEE